MASVNYKGIAPSHEPAKVGPHLIMVAAIFALIISLAAALPGRTALDERQPTKRVSATCHSPECLSPRQIITAKEGFRMKHDLGDHALLVDIRDPAEIPAGLTFGTDAQIPFLEPPHASASNGGAQRSELEFHIDFAMNVDEALRAKRMRHEEPVILMAQSGEGAELAALLLQEHGYTSIYVMRN